VTFGSKYPVRQTHSLLDLSQVRNAPMQRHEVLSSEWVEPRPHKMQLVCPGSGLELPSGQGEQSRRDLPFFKRRYVPAGQGFIVDVIVPAGQ
jgi:hypothetical protein